MKTFVALVLACMAFSGAAKAQMGAMPFAMYEGIRQGTNEETKRIASGFLGGAMEAYVIADSQVREAGESPLFCAPPKLGLTGGMAQSIVSRTSEELRSLGSNIDEVPVSYILLIGLRSTFPCD